jgi:hypothetical protein
MHCARDGRDDNVVDGSIWFALYIGDGYKRRG